MPVPVTTEPSATLPFPFPEPAGYGGSIIAWTTGRTGALEGDEEEEALGALVAGVEVGESFAAGLPEVEGNQFVGVEAKENDVDDCERAEEDGLEEEVVGEELPFMVNWGE